MFLLVTDILFFYKTMNTEQKIPFILKSILFFLYVIYLLKYDNMYFNKLEFLIKKNKKN